MATNRVEMDGRRLLEPVEAGTLSGSPCVVGSRCGVALTDRNATTGMATVEHKGVFTQTVTGITAIGTPIYYTANANPALRLNVVATALFFGYAMTVKGGAGAGAVDVYVGEASGISTLAANSLEGTVAANIADGNLIGGIQLLHIIPVANGATGNIDYVLTHTERIVNAWLVKTNASSGAFASSVALQTGAGVAITDAMALNAVADTTIVRATTIDDATHRIAAGGTLRVRRVQADPAADVTCILYVQAARVA